MTTNIYWNNEGRFQAEYDQLTKENFKWTKEQKNSIYKYYRYYNDGDRPMGAAYDWDKDVEDYLEEQANISIAKAFVKAHGDKASDTIKAYAKKSLQGYIGWENEKWEKIRRNSL